MEFFRGKTLIFKEFFRGEQRFHGILREKSTFSRISSGVDPFLREVFRGECSLVEFFRGKKKSYSSTEGVRILNAIAQYFVWSNIMLISTGIMLDSFKIMDGRDHIKKWPPLIFFFFTQVKIST